MSKHFDKFIQKNESRIIAIANELQYFKINAQRIRIKNAKTRIVDWLKNFEQPFDFILKILHYFLCHFLNLYRLN